MKILKKLRAHVNGLVKINTELYWYGSGWDNSQERVCILLDSALRENHDPRVQRHLLATSRWRRPGGRQDSIELQVLVDGQPCWILLYEENIEIIK